MINFLESADPTLRLSCRSWLSESWQLNRILDPILLEFIELSKFKKAPHAADAGEDAKFVEDQTVRVDGQLNSKNVIENFAKLRLVMNTQDRKDANQEAQHYDVIEYIIVKSLEDQGSLVKSFDAMV